MKVVRGKALTFEFSDEMSIVKYDDWPAFQLWAQKEANRKGVDIEAYRGRTVWFVEAKDFRAQDSSPRPSNSVGLAKTVDLKVRSSITGLVAVAATDDDRRPDKQFAEGAVAARQRRVVLHMEPPVRGSRLFPSKTQTANVLQRLRQLVRDIDSTPLVLRIANTADFGVPWTVS